MDANTNVPASADPRILHSMQHVARLRELADKQGMGFIGGFLLPDGTPFVMSNMEDDNQEEIIKKLLDK